MMTALAAGPDGVLRPGTAVDVPDAQAADLIAGGYAIDIPTPEPETATEAAAETAAAAASESTTVGPNETTSA
jgi:hypothetical protein